MDRPDPEAALLLSGSSGTAFDTILGRIRSAGLAYRSLPHGPDDHRVNAAFGGQLVYWSEPDGHVWELLTVSYERQAAPPEPPCSA